MRQSQSVASSSASSARPRVPRRSQVTSQNLIAADNIGQRVHNHLRLQHPGRSQRPHHHQHRHRSHDGHWSDHHVGRSGQHVHPIHRVHRRGGRKTGATTNGNPISLNIPATDTLSSDAVTGQSYTGTVTMGNGAVLLLQVPGTRRKGLENRRALTGCIFRAPGV